MSLHTVYNRSAKTDMKPVLQLENVSVSYRMPQERISSFKEYAIRWLKGQIKYQEFLALSNVSLEVEQGEVFGIIGPNGAGKSTLLKVVARVLRPTQGAVRIRGHLAPLLELGAGFDPELTGRENVYLNSAILGFSKRNIDRRIDRIVEFAGLSEFIDAPLRTYSTGMVARLGFSVATDSRPDILIVDEILSVGDAEFQTRSFERIQSFQAEGTTIFLVSHSLDRVQDMCSRAMWLDHGKVVATGSAGAIVNQYLGRVMSEEEDRLSQEVSDEPVQRWGSRKIEIVTARLRDGNGIDKAVFQTGDRLVLEMDYIAHEPILAPIFGVAVHRQDGIHLTGPNTRLAGLELPELRGNGTITYTVPHITLLDGLYHFSLAVVNQNDTEIYDYHDRTVSFRVDNRSAESHEQYGMVTLNGQWSHRVAAGE